MKFSLIVWATVCLGATLGQITPTPSVAPSESNQPSGSPSFSQFPSASPSQSLRSQLDAAISAWELLDTADYHFTFQPREPFNEYSWTPVNIVSVKRDVDGAEYVTSVQGTFGDDVSEPIDSFPTIGDLFAFISSALDIEASYVDVTYSPTYGYPMFLNISSDALNGGDSPYTYRRSLAEDVSPLTALFSNAKLTMNTKDIPSSIGTGLRPFQQKSGRPRGRIEGRRIRPNPPQVDPPRIVKAAMVNLLQKDMGVEVREMFVTEDELRELGAKRNRPDLYRYENGVVIHYVVGTGTVSGRNSNSVGRTGLAKAATKPVTYGRTAERPKKGDHTFGNRGQRRLKGSNRPMENQYILGDSNVASSGFQFLEHGGPKYYGGSLREYRQHQEGRRLQGNKVINDKSYQAFKKNGPKNNIPIPDQSKENESDPLVARLDGDTNTNPRNDIAKAPPKERNARSGKLSKVTAAMEMLVYKDNGPKRTVRGDPVRPSSSLAEAQTGRNGGVSYVLKEEVKMKQSELGNDERGKFPEAKALGSMAYKTEAKPKTDGLIPSYRALREGLKIKSKTGDPDGKKAIKKFSFQLKSSPPSSIPPPPSPMPSAMPSSADDVIPPFLVISIDILTPFDVLQKQLDAAKSLWNDVGDYTMTYRMICFCIPEFVDPRSVVVSSGNVESVVNIELNETSPDYISSYQETVTDVFDTIQTSIDSRSPSIDVTYDATLGYPRSVFIDRSLGIADEEYHVTIKDVVVGSPSPSP